MYSEIELRDLGVQVHCSLKVASRIDRVMRKALIHWPSSIRILGIEVGKLCSNGSRHW